MTEQANARSDGRLLVVCTGNVCRSPYMERRLRQELDGTDVEVASGGTGALVGEPIDAESAALLVQAGARTDDYAARQLTARLLSEADLVLTASRSHRAEVVQLHPKALRYTFTWGDFADLVRGLDPAGLGRPDGGGTWVGHVAAVAASRRGAVPPRSAADSDIVDPYRQPPSVFAVMARGIEADLPSIVRVLTPPIGG